VTFDRPYLAASDGPWRSSACCFCGQPFDEDDPQSDAVELGLSARDGGVVVPFDCHLHCFVELLHEDRRQEVEGFGPLGHFLEQETYWKWVPVALTEDVTAQVEALGVTVLGETTADVDGRTVTFIYVGGKDHLKVEAALGLPAPSTRARRRRDKAEQVAHELPPPPGRS
jgi:hypothetical protein